MPPVIGVPNDDLGEEVKARREVAPGVEAGPELERELIASSREPRPLQGASHDSTSSTSCPGSDGEALQAPAAGPLRQGHKSAIV